MQICIYMYVYVNVNKELCIYMYMNCQRRADLHVHVHVNMSTNMRFISKNRCLKIFIMLFFSVFVVLNVLYMCTYKPWQCLGVSPHDVDGVPVLIVIIHDVEQEVVTATSATVHKHLLKRHLKEGISQSS